jgi:hypothetical protein
VAFGNIRVTLGWLTSSTIALIFGNTPIGLGIPPWRLAVIFGM